MFTVTTPIKLSHLALHVYNLHYLWSQIYHLKFMVIFFKTTGPWFSQLKWKLYQMYFIRCSINDITKINSVSWLKTLSVPFFLMFLTRNKMRNFQKDLKHGFYGCDGDTKHTTLQTEGILNLLDK